MQFPLKSPLRSVYLKLCFTDVVMRGKFECNCCTACEMAHSLDAVSSSLSSSLCELIWLEGKGVLKTMHFAIVSGCFWGAVFCVFEAKQVSLTVPSAPTMHLVPSPQQWAVVSCLQGCPKKSFLAAEVSCSMPLWGTCRYCAFSWRGSLRGNSDAAYSNSTCKTQKCFWGNPWTDFNEIWCS